MSWEVVVIVLIYGAIVGSFLNVCIHRLPREESVLRPASRCPGCGHAILWRDNIPILGWLRLKGRCRHCHEPISWRYPAVELGTALLTLVTFKAFGLTPTGFALLLLVYAFVVLTMIDFDHYILPDVITLPGVVLGLGVSAVPRWFDLPLPTMEDALIGVTAGGGGLWLFAWIFKILSGKDGMGFGDVKLLAMIGAWLGWQALPFTLFMAACLGSVAGVAWILVSGRDRRLPIPFGPYLIAAALGYMFVGARVYDWYFAWVFAPNL